MNTYITTLGCPKNLVDTEACVSILRNAGCTLTENPNKADLLIVSACSFLGMAWQETLEEVQRLAEIKVRVASRKLVLMGCLPTHRKESLRDTLPMVDVFLPNGAHAQLPSIVDAWRRDRVVQQVTPPAGNDRFAGFEDRVLLTPRHTAYVKIAEGCSRRCSFCAIPQIRGKMVSRDPASIVREVCRLRERGVREISLLAQDTTSYRAQGLRFPDLVSQIAATGIDWLRIFYVHPGSLTTDLARRIFEHPEVCRYLEAPVQHASNRILRRMQRPYTRDYLEKLFSGIRVEFPDVRIRSEVIVGFPGESEDDFCELKSFVESVEFSSLGIFAYSSEPNTRAASLDGALPESLIAERVAELTGLRNSIAFGLRDAERGNRYRILVDREHLDEGAHAEHRFAGRHYGQAFDVDGEVMLKGHDVQVGQFVTARITEADVFDLRGEIV